MAGRLLDKVAVVTGAAPRGEGVGNGMATAIMFAREGAKVVLVNRSAERADKLAKQIKEEGGEAAVFAGDVAKAEAAEAMAAFAVKTYGRLDILHNNVGIGAPGTPETVTPADWHKVLEANMGAEARERRRNMVPMQTEGTAWDIAYGAVYLASDESRWVTGVLLPIDGGLVALRQWPR